MLEEVEGLTRVHGQEQSRSSKPIGHRGDGFRGEETVDLIPEHAAAIRKHHAELTNGSDLGLRRIQLEARRGDRGHRMHRMDPLEAELSQGIGDQGIGRADDIAVPANPGQRGNVEMVGMAVRDNENVDGWQTFRIDDALGTERDGAFLEGIAEDGIHEAGGIRQFHENRSVTEEGNLHADYASLSRESSYPPSGLPHPHAGARSLILVAMMKSFSCRPLIL